MSRPLSDRPRVHVLVPVYNCEDWLERNFKILAGQVYKDHTVHIVDDASTDRSPLIIEQWVDKFENWSWHRNEHNQKCPRNLWEGIQRINPLPHEVIFLLDGDDYLPNKRVLQTVADRYRDEYLWLSYGQYQCDPKNIGKAIPARDYPNHIYHNRDFRMSRLQLFNHPLIFRAHLWNALDEADLKDDEGNWFEIGYDKAIMLPLLEMATPDDGGSRHWEVWNDVLYIYNSINPLSDCHKEIELHQPVDVIWDRPKKKAHRT